VPDLVGLHIAAASSRLRAAGFSGLPALVRSRWVANNNVPAEEVVSQDLDPGMEVDRSTAVPIVVSAGGPATPVPDLPAQAQAHAERLNGFDRSELVLVVDTDAGTAFKTDAWLFGPCAAVDLAYRTFPDPAYGDSCYASDSN
jgi:hypothetical protein